MTTVPEKPNRVAYHRIDRATGIYRWWKPLAVAAIGFVIYLALALLVLAAADLIARSALSEADYAEHLRQLGSLNTVITEPFALAALLLSVAVMAPALFLARLIVRAGSIGTLSSVVGKIRWRWFALALIPAAIYMGIQILIGYLIAPAVTGEPLGAITTPPATYLACLIVILLFVPIQASAEEYVFRGFVLQAVGGWVRWPAVAIVASAIPFVFGHSYNLWGLAEILVFALVAAWITLRTGGLEAAIGVHILTNVMAFGIPALGFANVEEADGSVEEFVIALVLLPLYALAVDRIFVRSPYSREGDGQRQLVDLRA
ncbi:MAG TPA: CPBP family intramembrane glutamic endopeptidase [Glaciihabitans sp.]|nr:CPBP family intramembrane glutamic endopeptidase [Glaciihabitans sp.]